MTSPQTGRPSTAPHRVAQISFQAGWADCECGESVRAAQDPAYDRDEALLEAWLEHRRAAGAMRAKFRGDRYVVEAL